MQEEPVAALLLCSCREDACVHPGEAGVPAPEKGPGSAPWALPPLLRLVAKGPGAGRSTAPTEGGPHAGPCLLPKADLPSSLHSSVLGPQGASPALVKSILTSWQVNSICNFKCVSWSAASLGGSIMMANTEEYNHPILVR